MILVARTNGHAMLVAGNGKLRYHGWLPILEICSLQTIVHPVICVFLWALLAIAIVVGPATPVVAQETQDRTRVVRFMKSNQASKRDIGSARKLSGKVVVCHIFCFDGESQWQPAGKQRVLKLTQQAFAFIRTESLRHNLMVHFDERIVGPANIQQNISTDAMADPNWTEEAIKAASGVTGVELVTNLKNDLSADSVILCLHVNKSALSYNLAYYDNVAEKFSAERMVCFARYPDGRETAAATYAHEILHLYGAGDLYFPYDLTPRRKIRAGELFPHDVMYRVDYNIGRLNVGPFTAFRVGWTDNLASNLRAFEDD